MAMKKSDRIWALLGGLVFLLLNYPMLQIADRDTLVAGVPILPLYILVVWLLAIAGLYIFSRRLSSRAQADQKESSG
jgi:hypothetical protein